MEAFAATLLVFHISCGVVALGAGVSAAIARKRRGWHTRFGLVFVGAMFGIVLSAVPLTLIRPNAFLFLVALFSFQLTFSGWSSARLKGRDDRDTGGSLVLWRRRIASLAAFWSLGFVIYGLELIAKHGDSFGAVAITFGVLGGRSAWKELRLQSVTTNQARPWIGNHLQMMGGALIAATTASVVVNSQRLLPGAPPVVVWLLPTLIGSPIIFGAMGRWVRQPKTAAFS